MEGQQMSNVRAWLRNLWQGVRMSLRWYWGLVAVTATLLTFAEPALALLVRLFSEAPADTNVSQGALFLRIGLGIVLTLLIFVQAPYRGQRHEAECLREELAQEQQAHQSTRLDTAPLQAVINSQRLNPQGAVDMWVLGMDYTNIRNDVPRLGVQFRIENYLLDAIDFESDTSVRCTVRNENRPGKLNVHPLEVRRSDRGPIRPHGRTSFWLDFQIAEPTTVYLLSQDMKPQRWTFTPHWKFRIQATHNLFDVLPVELPYMGKVELPPLS